MPRAKTVVTANQKRSIVTRYGKHEGLVAIGEALSLSVTVVRRVLVEADVEIRGQGRPKTSKVTV